MAEECRTEAKKGSCPVCSYACHVKVYVKDGKIIRVTGDPNSPRGKRLCERFTAAVDFHYHPNRLNFPLKRVGERGEGKWKRITWEKAMSEIAEKLHDIRTRFGPEAVTVLGGNVNSRNAVAWRWCNLWGTPNMFAQGKNCGEAEILAECAIYGYPTMANMAPVPGTTKCAIIWGSNPWASRENSYWPLYIKARKAGTILVMIDPRLSESAKHADIWVQLRPGTDGALAFGMLNVIINEGLYDRDFIDRWCLGFDELKALVQKYPPAEVEAITWVPREKIVEVARLYATSKPAFLSWGAANAHIGRGTLSSVVGKSLLRAITGNLDVRGGNQFNATPEISAYLEEMHWDKLIKHPLRSRDNVSAHLWPIASVKALKLLREAQGKVYPRGMGPTQYIVFPGSHCLWSAILDEDPYPIKAVFLHASNPLLVLGNAKRIYTALKSSNLESFVAIERWMTPSAQLADYVLPSADNMERPELDNMWGFSNSYFARDKVTQPLYERKDDYYLWRDLGIRLGQEVYWPDTTEQWFDRILEPAKVSFKELAAREIPGLAPQEGYKAYEQSGFATFSGKVELTSSFFKRLGYPTPPHYQEPSWSPVSTPNLAKEFPLILISGGRVRPYCHSQHRQIDKLRNRYPYPLLQIHPETAQKLGIVGDDPVYLETPLGRISQRAKLTTGIDPRVVHADGYWWYPELPGEAPCLFGVWESNINAILPDDPELCDYAGDTPFSAMLCRVYKSKEL